MDTVKRKYLLLLTLILISFGLRSQFTGWSASTGYGKMLNIHPFTPPYGNAYFLKAEYVFMPESKKDWHSIYKVSELGWSLCFIEHGNPNILGKSIGLIPKIAFRKSLTTKFFFKTELGMGLAYFFKPYDNITNPQNYIIGSPLTAQINLSLAVSYQQFDLGFTFRHFSNGHIAVPNVGSNIPFGFMRYTFISNGSYPNYDVPSEFKTNNKKVRFSINLQAGLHEMEGTARPVDGPKYGVFGAQVLAEKIISNKSKIRLGSSFAYYQSFRNYLFNQNLLDQYSWWNSSKITAVLGHEFMFGRTSFFTDLMYNIYYPFKKGPLELGRIEEIKWMHENLSLEAGFNFYLKEIKSSTEVNPYFGIGIRTIGGKADYVFCRIGLSL